MNDKIDKKNVQDIFELSMIQKGMLFHYLNDENSNIYNAQLRFNVEGILDIDILKEALGIVQSNNEVLRSVFKWKEVSKPLQIILHECTIDIVYHDISQENSAYVLNFVEEYSLKDMNDKFTLTTVPFRLSIIKIAEKSYELYITNHHILYDGWSTGIILKELFYAYNQLVNNENPVFLNKSTYKEYQLTTSKMKKRDEEKEYWKNYLNKFEISSLSTKVHVSNGEKHQTKKISFKSAIDKLEAFSIEEKVTKAAIIYSTIGILLQRLKGESDVVFGTTVSNRDSSIKGIESIVGNFINSIPFRLKDTEKKSFLDVIKETHQDLIIRNQFNNTSYYEIKQLTDLKSSENLFDTLVVIENYPLDEKTINSNKDFNIALKSVTENTGIPLVISIFFKEELEIEVIYQTDTIDQTFAEAFLVNLNTFLEGILDNSNRIVDKFCFLTDNEVSETLVKFNNTEAKNPVNETVVSLFEKQAIRRPNNIAILCGNESITYADLVDKSNQIARYLKEEKHIKKGDLVGLMLDRDLNIIPIILGVLKAGAAFVPIDPIYPTDRINSIIKESRIDILLVKNDLDVSSFNSVQNVVFVNEILAKTYDNPTVLEKLKISDLAYVIFTSGSTGTPKGVMIEHGSLLNYINWASAFYVGKDKTTFPLYSSISFDLTITSIFTPLITGNTVIVYEEDDTSVLIEKVLIDNKVDIIKLTPSHLKIIRDSDLLTKNKSTLKKLIVGGEEFESKLSKDIFDKFNGKVKIYNEYGPTEATVGCMIYEFDPEQSTLSVPLGNPINNTQIYLLDTQMNPVSKGIMGEIHISGKSVAKGYLWRDDLTEVRFIDNPFIHGERMYKTGDYAIRLTDGTILFMGRIDEQVKISGFRIELREIENMLNTHSNVEECVVVAKEKAGHNYLVAYYLSESEINPLSLRSHLAEKLPIYMLPAHYIQIDSFPLTANGKLNVKALPEPELKGNEDYEAPSSLEEKLLVNEWSKVLGIPKLGITDNYFSVGGDSIVSIQISSKMRNAGYEVSVQDIFKNPTIKELALKIKPVISQSDQSVVSGSVELSPIQRWFFNNSSIDQHYFNQSSMIHFKKSITSDTVFEIFTKIFEHHDALRIVFNRDNGRINQENIGLNFPISLEEKYFDNDDEVNKLILKESNRIQASIDLENGPLIKLGLFQTVEGSQLLIVIHHLVVDGVSWRILFEDIKTLYNQILNKQKLTLPLKTDSFQKWSKSLTEYTKTDIYEKAKLYWHSLSNKNIDLMKRDFQEGINMFSDHCRESFKLKSKYTSKLLGDVHKTFGTQINDILLTALLLSIHKQFGLKSLLIDLEGHGREDIIQGINTSRTIGWFTSIYPVILEKNEKGLNDQIKTVKEHLKKIPNNGIDYLLNKYFQETDNQEFRNKNEVKSQISFNYLGQLSSDYESFFTTQEGKGNEVSLNMSQNYDWNIIGFVSNGEFALNLVYSKQQYKKETINAFMNTYKSCLEEVIDYCVSYNKPELSPSDLTYNNLSIEELDVLQNKYDIEDIYTLSSMQEGMLFHSVLESNSEMYFEQKVLTLKGDISVETVEQSMNDLMNRHDIFRTVFLYKNYERPIQIVLKERKIDFSFFDIRKDCIHSSKNELIESYQKNDAKKAFDLSKDVLMRIVLLQTQDDEFVLIWSHHHILMDGWCTSIVWNDFKLLYSNKRLNKNISLLPAAKYANYIEWLEDRNKKDSITYWESYLSNYGSLATIPKKTVSQTINRDYDLSSQEFIIDSKRVNFLKKVSKENSVTLNTILQTAWGIVLSKYNNTKDVVFGSVISGRPSEITGIENMVGLFINTIPVRVKYEEKDSVIELLKNCQNKALQNEQHQYHPLSEIQSLSDLGNELFDHILVFENYPISEKIINKKDEEAIGFTVTDIEVFEQTNYDLVLMIIPGDEIQIKIDYNQNKYSNETIERLLNHLNTTIVSIIENNDSMITELDFMSENERIQLLNQFNYLDVDFPKDKTIIDLFIEQVERTPNSIAITFEDEQITYYELHKRSSEIAILLRENGVKPDCIVGLFMNRSIDVVIGMLAILKAGGAYLPIDIDYPKERIEYIIKDSGTTIILTDRTLENEIDFNVLTLFIEDSEEISDMALNIQHFNKPSDLCYVIYTSGTTGNPKGVMIEHRNVVRLLFNDKFQYDFNSSDVWTMFHSHCFDVSVWEIYGALLFGGKLIVIPKMLAKDTKAYLEILKNEKVTILNQTPSALYNLIYADLSEPEKTLSLRYVILAGEELSPRKLKAWKVKYPDVLIINKYGITETTVHNTYKEIKEFEIENNISNIGIPIPTLSMLILNEYQKLVPNGVIGELYVGGDGLARGYLNNEELTNKRFIPNPYKPEERLYRSGDLAKVMESGELEYKGRIDHQVQLRGFRVELGEIENQLIRHNQINEILVQAKEIGGEKHLLAYYIANKELDITELRHFLLNKLPDYMVPSYFLKMERFPLTPNGKLDKKALPDPELKTIEASAKPNNQVQKELVSIWADLLNIKEDKIGINTNFFDIGGNSLKLMKMVDKINTHFETEITVAKVFTYPVISSLAEFLNKNNESDIYRSDALIDTDMEQMNDAMDILNQI
ncbi:amino acid adenylation domain-containing protein [Flavobacterium jejuense]|uniref:Amino acid adenylation domain-containing protein n=1 Tax=Flavobacterium jejuense TaxID=1544455 RepID=A0ABX0IQU8_9FLAO|nr:non-ribosomal peptide synthetase [Flavobacterium jejuense]NHN25923.1 amino acid adenylation domain-containing protein [Flavobacterium jejuense]